MFLLTLVAVGRNRCQLGCMRLSLRAGAMILLMGGCTSKNDADLVLGSPSAGRWIPFYTRSLPPDRLEYFYDSSAIEVSRGNVLSRWKILGSRESTTTLYLIEISCPNATFTEKGTIITDAKGLATELMQSKLLIDHPIEEGTSSDLFRRKFCPLQETRKHSYSPVHYRAVPLPAHPCGTTFA
jgi:hypothetical protein